jgi:hypothetical protein
MDTAESFSGWPQYILTCLIRRVSKEVRIGMYPLLVESLEGKIEHPGSLFGLPRPPRKEVVVTEGFLHPDEVFILSAKSALVRRYLKLEERKAIEKMAAEIDEKGVGALWSYLKEHDKIL